MVSRWSAKAALKVSAKGVESRKRSLGGDVDDVFLGFSPDFGVRMAVLLDLAAYGKETWKMSENKVVHHKTHYRKLLPQLQCSMRH